MDSGAPHPSTAIGSAAAATPLPLEWAVCPGATENAYTSMMPHGTIITANSFTSLFLLRAELSSWERVQYEVHLLTGGLMQIGWCVTASGLPFTTNEGVGDFPLSVAADGCRGMLWNLTGDKVPSLRWKPGDILGCSADFATGTFDFSLNGVACCSATLPTKGVLLQQGAKWFTDKYSNDEMLTYSPALSLAVGEACLVNLGEAPFRYPRGGYVSLEMHHQFGSLAYVQSSVVTTESASSGAVSSGMMSQLAAMESGGPSLATPPASLPSGPALSITTGTRSSTATSVWSSASAVRVGLGGSDLEDLFIALDIRHLPADEDAGPLELLARCIAAPARRVSETLLTLISWFEADTQGRWRAFCMVLYLWVLRFYGYDERAEAAARCSHSSTGVAHARPYRAPVIGAEPITRIAQSLSVENRRKMTDMFVSAKVFLPAEHFLVVPGILVAILQHRMGNTPHGQETAARIVSDLVAIDVFRRGWVRETGTFCSTLLNLCALHAPSVEELKMLSELIAKHVPSSGTTNHSNRETIELLIAMKPVCARQGRTWLLAEQCMEQLVADEGCRGALVTALLRFISDTQLRSPVSFTDPLRTPSYNDGLPYTFSLYMQPMVMGLLVLSVLSALGKVLWAVDQPCPISNADPFRALCWRDIALSLLPVHEFYLRGLTGYGLMPTNWPDVRVGGTFHYVRRFIREEAAAIQREERLRRSTNAGRTPAGPRGSAEEDAPSLSEAHAADALCDDDSDASLPEAVTRRHRMVTGPKERHALTPTDPMEARTEGAKAAKSSEASGAVEAPASGPREHVDAVALAVRAGGDAEEVREGGLPPVGTAATSSATSAAGDGSAGREDADSAPPALLSQRDFPRSPVSVDTNMSFWMTDSRFWETKAEQADQSRGHFTELNVTDHRVDDAGRDTEAALEERGKELPLVAAIASSLFVRPLLASSLVFLEAINDAIPAYLQSRRGEQGLASPSEEVRSGAASPLQEPTAAAAAAAAPDAGDNAREAGHDDDEAGPRLPAHDRLRGIAISAVPLVTLMEQSTLQGLMRFTGGIGKAVSYFWSRMALFERLHAFPDAAARARDDPAFAELWRQEAEETLVCPPRAFLMLPLDVLESSLDLWFFSGVTHRQSTVIAERYPGLLLSSFDAMRRRTVSPSETRAYMYRAMASLLGFGAENRRQAARLMLEQEAHCAELNAAELCEGEGRPRNWLPVVPVLQGSILDCLDVYMREDNFNDTAALNFLFALAQEERCFLPPPRMLDENFWWCLQPRGADAAAAVGDSATSAAEGLSADEAYFQIFCRSTRDVDLLQYSAVVISKCNRLLTQFSQLRPVANTRTMTTSAIKAYHTKYTLLRKSLYVLDFILQATAHNEEEASRRRADAAARTAEDATAVAVEPPSTPPSPSVWRNARVPVHVFLRRSQREAVLSALMDVITQTLVRVSFRSDGAGSRVSREAAAASGFSIPRLPRGLQTAAHAAAQEETAVSSASARTAATGSLTGSTTRYREAGSPTTHPIFTTTQWLSATSEGSATSMGFSFVSSEPPWSENVLLPARARAVNGRHVCSSAACTVTGLLSPVFHIMYRLLERREREHNGGAATPSPFPLVASDMEVLLSRGLELLEHPAWWAAAPPLRGNRQGDDDEYFPLSSQVVLRELQDRLRSLKAEVEASQPGLRPAQGLARGGGSDEPLQRVAAAAAAASTSQPTTARTVSSRTSTPAVGVTAINRRLISVPDEFDEEEGEAPLSEGTGAEEEQEGREGDAKPTSSHARTAAQEDTHTRAASSTGHHEAGGDDDGEDASVLCQICLERPADIAMMPCGDRCCHVCFTRSHSTPEMMQLPNLSAMGVAPATATTLAALPDSTSASSTSVVTLLSFAAAAPHDTDAAEGGGRSLFPSGSIFTQNWASFASTPTAPSEHQCPFCKQHVEYVASLASRLERSDSDHGVRTPDRASSQDEGAAQHGVG